MVSGDKMCKTNGYDNEFAFVLELNNKAINELNPLCRDLIETIFPNENENSTIHFSVLTIQPKNRCLNYNSKYENDRFCVQVKWYNLFDDIIENMYLKKHNKKEVS